MKNIMQKIFFALIFCERFGKKNKYIVSIKYYKIKNYVSIATFLLKIFMLLELYLHDK